MSSVGCDYRRFLAWATIFERSFQNRRAVPSSIWLIFPVGWTSFEKPQNERVAIKLVFDDWRDRQHRSIYSTEKGVELSSGQLHSGTTFDAEIVLPPDHAADLRRALDEGYVPVFWVSKP